MNNKEKILLFLFIILWVCKPIPYKEVVYNQNQFVQQKVIVFRTGGQNSTDRSNIDKKILLENLFPDWPERVAYQEKQEKYYNLAQAKLREARKLRIYNKYSMKLLTVQKKEALDYFNGIGFYKKYQNPKTLPNIFDTRQSFLVKMEYPEVRETFLNSYNNRFKKDN